MESILIKHINMPQTSRHIRVPYTDFTSTGSYTYDIPMPQGAIVEKANVITTTAFATGTVTLDIGDGETNAAGSYVGLDKFMDGTDVSAAGRFESDATAGEQFVVVAADNATDDNEPSYYVRVTAVVDTAAPTAGEFVCWVDFRYDPNEIYS
jgi:hypothetical protein